MADFPPSFPHLSDSLVDPQTGIAIPHIDTYRLVGTQLSLPGTGTGPDQLTVKEHVPADACQPDFRR